MCVCVLLVALLYALPSTAVLGSNHLYASAVLRSTFQYFRNFCAATFQPSTPFRLLKSREQLILPWWKGCRKTAPKAAVSVTFSHVQRLMWVARRVYNLATTARLSRQGKSHCQVSPVSRRSILKQQCTINSRV